jgi:hypothetical protein
VLGQYFAAMYPSKVGRLVIDKVVDANNYYLDDMDAVVLSFFKFCHQAGLSKCPLYGSLCLTFKNEWIPIPFASKGPVVITKKLLHQLMFVALYGLTVMFPMLANSLVAIETENISALTNQLFDLGECNCASLLPWQQFVSTSAAFSIACSDADKHPNGPDDYKSYFDKLMAKLAFAAPIWGMNRLPCSE